MPGSSAGGSWPISVLWFARRKIMNSIECSSQSSVWPGPCRAMLLDAPRLCPASGEPFTQTLFLRHRFGRGDFGEILHIVHLPDFNLGIALERVRAALDPLDRLFLRFHLE